MPENPSGPIVVYDAPDGDVRPRNAGQFIEVTA
jgi:hypothetical protein